MLRKAVIWFLAFLVVLVPMMSASASSGWLVRKVLVDNDFYGVSCPTTTMCLAVGSIGQPGRGVIVRTVNGGQSWTHVPISSNYLAVPSFLAGLSCPSVKLCYAAGASFKNLPLVLVSSNGGLAWSTKTLLPTAGLVLTGVTCPSQTTCFAYGHADPTG